MGEPRVKGKSQNVGNAPIRCGCGAVVKAEDLATHRREQHGKK